MSTYFLHIGKTGGTAIKETLASAAAEHDLVFFNHQKSLRDVPEGGKIIFVLRDPLSRFVSAFNSRLRKGQPRYNVAWTGAEGNAFRRFKTPNELAVALSSRDIKRQQAAEKAMTKIRHVGNRFSQWLISEAYLKKRQEDVLFIGFQETLDHDFGIMKQILDLPAELHLPHDPILAHTAPSTLDKRLDEVASANLRKWYAEDYKLLEICRKLRETKEWDKIEPRVAELATA